MWKSVYFFPTRFLILLLISYSTITWAGTTGKIAGRVVDATNNEPLIGANVMVEGKSIGTITDVDGFYTINNIPPGTYSVVVSFIGYRKYTVTDVIIKIDLTTQVDAKLQPEAIQAEEVVVRAERPLVQKDLTSTSVIVSSEDLKRIPTETIGQVLNLQAGVVRDARGDIHFRGGRSNEVAYLIDGVLINDPFNGLRSLEIDNTAIRQMEVISGTFNAEYGQAMSGIVNIVTQEGSDKYHGSLSAYTGDYFTSHTDVFANVNKLTSFRTKNLQGSISGPVPLLSGLSFYTSGRYYIENGYLYGKRVYNVQDRSPYILTDNEGNAQRDLNNNYIYIFTRSGDSAYVPMNPSKRLSLNGKLSYSFTDLKFNYSIFWDDQWNKYYDHEYAWTPDGIKNHYRKNWIHSFQVVHSLSANTYQTLKLSYNLFDYEGYLYKDTSDVRYVEPNQGLWISNYTFRSGGNQSDRYDRYTKSYGAQWSLASQLSSKHKVSVGVEARKYEIYNHWMTIVNQNTVEKDSTGALIFIVGYSNLHTSNNNSYYKQPFELSSYIQDKMEYDIMIINIGVRFDYFDPNSSYPSDLTHPNTSLLKKASSKLQVSPRFGVSFPITDQGIIHFSYGHFFQMPSFERLYYNSDYIITESSGLTEGNRIGNPDLDAQRSVMYELGLQQVLFSNVGLDFTVYSRDIRNLLGMEILSTYEGIKYTRFINRDYANVKGFILSLDKHFSDFYSIKLDYTYQITEGNASDPLAEYYNNRTDPPVETNKKVVPLDWDQRSTLNFSITVGEPNDWNVGAIMQWGTGFPYTENIRVSGGLRFENGGTKPSTFNVDLRAEKTFSLSGLNFTAFALIYNLLDTKNEKNVNDASGRSNVDLYTGEAGDRHALNTIEEYVNNPDNFSAPRQIRFGLTVDF